MRCSSEPDRKGERVRVTEHTRPDPYTGRFSAMRYLRDDSGAALSEYALIASILCLSLIAALGLISVEASTQLTSAQTNLTNASSITGNQLP
jgi:Flp pilus assembly pilin Flp